MFDTDRRLSDEVTDASVCKIYANVLFENPLICISTTEPRTELCSIVGIDRGHSCTVSKKSW